MNESLLTLIAVLDVQGGDQSPESIADAVAEVLGEAGFTVVSVEPQS